jgi:hypothetical protein
MPLFIFVVFLHILSTMTENVLAVNKSLFCLNTIIIWKCISGMYVNMSCIKKDKNTMHVMTSCNFYNQYNQVVKKKRLFCILYQEE